MADQINLAFPDQSYSTSNKPSIITLKDDLTMIEDEFNQAVTEINEHETRLDDAEADVVDLQGASVGLINGKIVTSVSSNNLTVAVKTLAGADPSASDPVYVRIGNTVRTITAALSVTKAAGTNWGGAGSAATATLEVDWFVYVVWNTTPATDAVTLGFSRVPYGNLYSDFSGTTTNQAYLAFSGSDTPASTDEVQNIGRFNAILSATASFNWSLPATSIIINHPIFETRLLSWTPGFTGFSVNPTAAYAKYKLRMDIAKVLYQVGSAGTSNTTAFTITQFPLFIVSADNAKATLSIPFVDNGSSSGVPAMGELNNDILTVYTNGAFAGWTASGSKAVRSLDIEYPLR